MRFLLMVVMALLLGCAAPSTEPRYAEAELDTAAKRFEPPTGKARIYATTSLFKVCTYIVGCVNTSRPIPVSVHVNLQYAGDLTNLDNFVFVDVDPGDTDLYFTVRGTTNNPVAGARARLRAEEGGVYFYRFSGGAQPRHMFSGGAQPRPMWWGAQPRPMSDVGTTLLIGTQIEQFAVDQLSEAGRSHIMERRLVLPSVHQGVAGTRLTMGRQPSPSSSYPSAARSDPSGQRNAARPPATGTSEPQANRDRSSQSSPPVLGTAPSPATQARSPTSPQNQIPRNGEGQNGVSPTPSEMRNLNRNVEELERMLELYGRL